MPQRVSRSHIAGLLMTLKYSGNMSDLNCLHEEESDGHSHELHWAGLVGNVSKGCMILQ